MRAIEMDLYRNVRRPRGETPTLRRRAADLHAELAEIHARTQAAVARSRALLSRFTPTDEPPLARPHRAGLRQRPT